MTSALANLDWLFYTLAAVVGALGLLLFGWALFRDRARGRRRCPKCWYDMSGIPGALTCSECGKTAKRERQLFKTRRRWRWAIVAILVLGLALASHLTPRVGREGWTSIAPSTVLILLTPELEERNPDLFKALLNRCQSGRLWDWQFAILARRLIDQTLLDQSLITESRPIWPDDVDAYFAVRMTQSGWEPPAFHKYPMRLRISSVNGDHEDVLLPRRSFALENWRRNFGHAGPFRSGTSGIPLTITVEYRYQRPGRGNDEWVRILQWRRSQPVIVTDGAGLDFEGVRSSEAEAALRDRLWCAVYDRSMRVLRAFPAIGELDQYAALGLRFELVLNGEVVAHTDGWWCNNDARRLSECLFWRWCGITSEDIDANAGGRWILRVRGERDVALRAFDDLPRNLPEPVQYWQGEVEIPLRVSSDGGYLHPDHDLPSWLEWAWDWQYSQTTR